MPLLQMQHVTYNTSNEHSTKYVAHMSPTATVTMVCCCFHGSKVSIATKCYHWFAVVPRNMCTKQQSYTGIAKCAWQQVIPWVAIAPRDWHISRNFIYPQTAKL